VDDEHMVVKDLIDSIPWLENGFEVIGSNTDSLSALAEITEMKPDVVFTDLKMPICDGIELTKSAKENGVDAEFVMLSAYEDFKACREFYQLEGFDYIDKPLNQENAAFVLEKLSRKLASKHHKTPTVQFAPSQSSGFDDLVTFVAENFNKKHTLEELSGRYSMNPTYICDLFSKQYESTLTIFVTNLRMEEASRLILKSDTPLKEISAYCGFQNYRHFCRVFKTHFNKSPSQYREDNG